MVGFKEFGRFQAILVSKKSLSPSSVPKASAPASSCSPQRPWGRKVDEVGFSR